MIQSTNRSIFQNDNIKVYNDIVVIQKVNNAIDKLEENDLEDDGYYEDVSLQIKFLIIAANEKLNQIVNLHHFKRTFTTEVRFYLVFLRVGDIDNVQERFETTALIEACWEDNSIQEDTFDYEKHWDPEIYIENSMGNLKQDISHKIVKKGKNTFVIETRKIKGYFWEKLELHNFPLDDQDLSITITSSRSKDEVQFELSEERNCVINTEDFQQQQEWLLFPNIQSEKKVIYDLQKKYDRPAYTISSKVARRPGFFLNNAYMLIFFITVLSFVPFSFSNVSPHFRIQTTLLLILSSVNFRWIVTQRLPSISYLTILDKYAITALIFMVMLCIWHAIIGSPIFNNSNILKTDRDFIDQIALITIAAFFLLFHFVYVIYFVFKYLRYNKLGKSTNDKDSELNDDKKSRPVTISSVKPMIKSGVVTPTNTIHNINGDVRYRNLVESRSINSSIDIQAISPFPPKDYQQNNDKKN